MKKNNKLLITLGVLLLVTIGSSFAYFVAKTAIKGTGAEANIETANLIKVEYDAGSSSLNAEGLVPNHKASKTFTISVTPTELEKSVMYAINLNIDTNTFVKCDDSNYEEVTNECKKGVEELVYYLKDSNGNIIATGDITGVTGKIVLIKEKKEVTSKTDYNYTLEIEFKETNADQNHNANKTITGSVSVEFTEITAKDIILANNTIDDSRVSGEFTSIFEEDTAGRIFKGPADDYGSTTYFFAGKDPNNWLQFAGKWWRIIRINGDGSVRLIYAGSDASNEPSPTGEDTQIGTSVFNDQNNDNAYVGYMYGEAGQSGDNAYALTHANTNSSTIKGVLDTWYEDNIGNNDNYSDKIAINVGFCGDKKISIVSRSGYGALGYGSNPTAYVTVDRIMDSSWQALSVQNSILKCSDNNDLYTFINATKGNKILSKPIGLITVDEVVLLGGYLGTDNSHYWLYTGQGYWTMSPYAYDGINAYELNLYFNGDLGYGDVSHVNGVRPVINLKSNTQLIGSGTTTDPYKVE